MVHCALRPALRSIASRNAFHQLRCRSVLVTGGANGIGEAIARRLIRDGNFTHITIADVDKKAGQQLQEEFPKSLRFVYADMSNPEDVANAVEVAATFDEAGMLHAVVNNAGVLGPSQNYADYDIQEWQRVLDTNLNGVFYGLKYGLAQMMSQIPRLNPGDDPNFAIVNISSTAGSRGVPQIGPYTASKWAVNGMTQAAAVEYAPHRIRVNAIAPTSTETPMIKRYVESSPDPMAAEKQLTAMNALPGLPKPDDIAGPCSFLLSEDAKYITGHILFVDGGALAKLF